MHHACVEPLWCWDRRTQSASAQTKSNSTSTQHRLTQPFHEARNCPKFPEPTCFQEIPKKEALRVTSARKPSSTEARTVPYASILTLSESPHQDRYSFDIAGRRVDEESGRVEHCYRTPPIPCLGIHASPGSQLSLVEQLLNTHRLADADS